MSITVPTKGRSIRYTVSLFLFVGALSSLVIGSIGVTMSDAVAHENRQNQWSHLLPMLTNRQSTPVERAPQPVVTPPPAQTDASTPAPAPQPTVAPVQPTPPARVTPRAIPAPTPPVDSAPVIATMTATQATSESAPVTYTSRQISPDTRDRLLVLASIAAAVGVVIYILSLFNTGGLRPRSVAPIRYRIPVREVIRR